MHEQLQARLLEAALHGQVASVWADVQPDQVAVIDPWGQRTFAQISAAANRLVRALRRLGVGPGDPVAVVCSNRAEMIEILDASMCGGWRLTPVNWRLKREEIAYILDNCGAKAVIVEARFEEALAAAGDAEVPRRVVLGEAAGFLDYDELLAAEDGADLPDPHVGSVMLYTSGTTGRPKGVYRANPVIIPPTGMSAGGVPYDRAVDRHFCPGPAYHAAPLAFDIRAALNAGVPVVFAERWDSEGVLGLIDRHGITHSHMVPVMFQRLLALPEHVRGRYSLASLKQVMHGAAPTPPEVKRAMMAWLGPKLLEYYGGSEGGVIFYISAAEWLAKPGSVGKVPLGAQVRILDDDGRPLPNGETGGVYLQSPAANPFVYFKDPEKTASTYRGEFFTLGDVGHFDADGYLFLTGRTAECIISGGVNIYPQEIDNEILKHPAVEDCCTVGAPNEEFGEEVRSIVALKPGAEATPELAEDIRDLVRAHLAGYKVPRVVEFVDEVPRNSQGKLLRKDVRARYWAGRERQI